LIGGIWGVFRVRNGSGWAEKWKSVSPCLEVLKWAREHGCPWDERTCTCAAHEGRLVGRCRLMLSQPELKPRLISALETKM
jgi:hypothetical protein